MMTILVDSTAKTTEIGPCESLARQHGKRPRTYSSSSTFSDESSCSTVGADEAGNEERLSRDFNVDQHTQRNCSREHFRPGYTFPYPAKTTERPEAQLDSANQAFGEAEVMAENEERSSPRSLQVPRCSSAGGNFAPPSTRPSRISTERAYTSRTSPSPAMKDMSPALRHSQLAAPASIGAVSRGMIDGTDMRAPACAPSQTWCSSLGSQSTCHKGSERPGEDSPRQSERSGSGSLEHFKAHRGNLASTWCDLSAELSKGRRPPEGDQRNDCNRNGLSRGASSSGNRCSFPLAGREALQTTMNQFDSARNTVRRDLQLYMKAVREK